MFLEVLTKILKLDANSQKTETQMITSFNSDGFTGTWNCIKSN